MGSVPGGGGCRGPQSQSQSRSQSQSKITGGDRRDGKDQSDRGPAGRRVSRAGAREGISGGLGARGRCSGPPAGREALPWAVPCQDEGPTGRTHGRRYGEHHRGYQRCGCFSRNARAGNCGCHGGGGGACCPGAQPASQGQAQQPTSAAPAGGSTARSEHFTDISSVRPLDALGHRVGRHHTPEQRVRIGQHPRRWRLRTDQVRVCQPSIGIERHAVGIWRSRGRVRSAPQGQRIGIERIGSGPRQGSRSGRIGVRPGIGRHLAPDPAAESPAERDRIGIGRVHPSPEPDPEPVQPAGSAESTPAGDRTPTRWPASRRSDPERQRSATPTLRRDRPWDRPRSPGRAPRCQRRTPDRPWSQGNRSGRSPRVEQPTGTPDASSWSRRTPLDDRRFAQGLGHPGSGGRFLAGRRKRSGPASRLARHLDRYDDHLGPTARQVGTEERQARKGSGGSNATAPGNTRSNDQEARAHDGCNSVRNRRTDWTHWRS